MNQLNMLTIKYPLFLVIFASAVLISNRLLATSRVNADVIFVDDDAASGGDGSSWERAYNNLQDAIDDATGGVGTRIIWMKEGVYKPGNHPEDTFHVLTEPCAKTDATCLTKADGLEIYGGFNQNLKGTNGSVSSRNWKNHPAILDGQNINRHVVTIGSLIFFDQPPFVGQQGPIDMVVDGLTVTRGYASAERRFSPLRNISDNVQTYGAGIFVSGAELTLRNMTIEGNTAVSKYIPYAIDVGAANNTSYTNKLIGPDGKPIQSPLGTGFDEQGNSVLVIGDVTDFRNNVTGLPCDPNPPLYDAVGCVDEIGGTNPNDILKSEVVQDVKTGKGPYKDVLLVRLAQSGVGGGINAFRFFPVSPGKRGYKGLILENSVVKNNVAYRSAGGLFAHETNVLVKNSTFDGNIAGPPNAKLVLREPTATEVNAGGVDIVTEDNSLAGGIESVGLVLGKPVLLTVDKSLFTDNKSSQGGAILVATANLHVKDSQFNGNSAHGALPTIYPFDQGMWRGRALIDGLSPAGGAIYLRNDSGDVGAGGQGVIIEGSTFKNNSADLYGGAIASNGSSPGTCGATSALFGNAPCSFTFASHPVATIGREDGVNIFENNNAPLGGAIFWGISETLRFDQVPTEAVPSLGFPADGFWTLFYKRPELSINYNKFKDNHATIGGAIASLVQVGRQTGLNESGKNEYVFDVTHNTYANNSADLMGGALAMYSMYRDVYEKHIMPYLPGVADQNAIGIRANISSVLRSKFGVDQDSADDLATQMYPIQVPDLRLMSYDNRTLVRVTDSRFSGNQVTGNLPPTLFCAGKNTTNPLSCLHDMLFRVESAVDPNVVLLSSALPAPTIEPNGSAIANAGRSSMLVENNIFENSQDNAGVEVVMNGGLNDIYYDISDLSHITAVPIDDSDPKNGGSDINSYLCQVNIGLKQCGH